MFALLMIFSPTTAATFTWDGDGGDGMINNGANWVGGASPNWTTTTTDSIVFDAVAGGASTTPQTAAGDNYIGGNQTGSGVVPIPVFTFNAGAPAYTFNYTNSTDYLVLRRTTASGTPYNLLENKSSATQTFNVNFGATRRAAISATAGDLVFNGEFAPGYQSTTSGSGWIRIEGAHNVYLNGIIFGASGLDTNSAQLIAIDGGGGAVAIGDAGTAWNGKLVLSGDTLDATRGRSDGRLLATNNNSFGGTGGGTYIMSTPTASQSSTQLGTGRVELDNAFGVTVGESFGLEGRGGAAATAFHILNTSGNNTINGNLFNSGGGGNFIPATAIDQTEYNLGSNGGSLTISGNITQGQTTGARNLNLGGISTANNTISGVIQQAAGASAWNLVKRDAGKWILAGANTYTGTTTISGGTLVLDSTGSIAASSSINVQSGTFDVSAVAGGFILGGTQTLKGGGAVTGAVTTTSGSILAPGASAGTITLNGPLSLVDGTVLQYELSNNIASGNDRIQLNGNLTLSGSSTLAVTMLNGALGTGSYRLIDYTGTLTGNAGNFALSGLASGSTRQSFSLLTGNDVGGTANQVNLKVTGAAQNIAWKNGVSSYNWELVGAASNWTSSDGKFYNLDNVTFNNTGSNASNINLTTTLNPASLTFTNNSGHNYAFAGGGAIVGSTIPLALGGSGNATFGNSAANTFGDVTVSGAGTLTFSNTAANTLGNVSVSGGNLTFANGANANALGNLTIGGGTVNVANGAANTFASLALNGGTLTFNQSVDVSLANALTGAGNLQQQGSRILTIAGTTSGFTGSVAVAAGATLQITASTAFTSASGITVASGATLELVKANVGTTSTAPVHVGGAGVGGNGAVMDNSTFAGGTDTYGVLHNVVLTGDTTIANTNPAGVWGFGFSTIHAPLSATNLPGTLQGNGYTLTKIGVGEIDIENVFDTHLGNINVFGGNLVFQYEATLGSNPGVVTINDTDASSKDAALGLYQTPEIHGKPITIGANGGGVTAWRGTIQMISPITTTAGSGGLRLRYSRSTGSFYLRGPITGPGGLTSSASAAAPRIYLSNDSNTFTGEIVVQSGNLVIGEAGTTGSLGAAASIELQGGVLAWNLNKAYTVAKTYFGAGGVDFGENNVVRQLPNAVVTVNLDSTYSGPTNIYQGKVILKTNNGFGADGGNVSVLSNATSTTGGELDLDNAAGLTINQNFIAAGSGGYGGFFYGGPGVIRNVAGANKINGGINLNTGNGLIVSAGGSLELAGTIGNLAASAERAIVLGGTAPGLVSGSIADGTAARTMLEKIGAGTWTISGYGYSTGATNIYEGALALTGGAGLGTAAITLEKSSATFDVSALSAGAFSLGGAGVQQVLQGAGTVKGNLAFYSINNLISTGGPAVINYPAATPNLTQNVNAPSGPLTIQGDFSLGDGGNTLQFSLAGAPGSSNNGKITVTAALTKGLYYDTNVLIVPQTSLTAGRYTLLSASSVVANPYGFVLDPLLDAGQNTRYGFTLDNATDPKKLDLVVTGSNANLTWTGAISADWDLKLTPNWSGAADEKFYQADAVTFGDGPTATAVNLAGVLRPASITVNSASDYTFGGTSGRITGGTGIVKSGSGVLTISNYHDNGTPALLTDDYSNDFTGTVTIAGGTLKVGNASALGNSSNGGVYPNAGTVVDGGTLDLNGQNVSPETIAVKNNGSLVNNGTANSYLLYVELTGNATFGGSRFWQINSGAASPMFTLPYLKGNNFALTKVGTNEVDLTDMGETNLGAIFIQAGSLWFVGSTTMGNAASTVAISNNAQLVLQDCTVVHAKPVVVDATGGTIFTWSGNNTMSGGIALNGAGTLSTGNGSTLTLNGVISGAGGLTKINYNAAGGTVILGGNNSYQGPTLISAGKLELTATGQISTASAITNNATFQIDGGTHALGTIGGTGAMYVFGTSAVTAVSITQGALSIGGAAPAVAAAAAVPEPGMWSLLLLGLVVGAIRRYVRKR
ncbi:MAG: autotransporter-associated beta strand repeat-containing protein [Pirellulales bacterium]|nr:autotransporter-associated beta strand repeat-containing protein [Pirellulales bacterium]